MIAITISSAEFRENQKKYFDMLSDTKVFIKRGKKFIELVERDSIDVNPSPSYDKWFDKPENIAIIAERIEAYEKNKANCVSLDDAKKEWKNIK